MRYYVITGIATVIIFLIVAALWSGWGINLEDFVTGLALILAATILPIWWWAYNKERGAKKRSMGTDLHYSSLLKNIKPKKDIARHPKLSGIESNLGRTDRESKRQREHKWRFFPSNYK